MKDFRIFSLDLGHNEKNYAFFSGYLVSQNDISRKQLDKIKEIISKNNRDIKIKSFDSEGEELEDYCPDFDFFDLNNVKDKCFVVMDINFESELNQIFLMENDNILLFDVEGNLSNLKV